MAKSKKKGTGRPTKWNEKIRSAFLRLAKYGLTDVEMAAIIGVSESTLNRWKERYPEFWESLNENKATADEAVERALYQRAKGGKWGDKDYPPDPTSMIFWLKNRQPHKWRDKRGIEVLDEEGNAQNLGLSNIETATRLMHLIDIAVKRKNQEPDNGGESSTEN